MPGLISPFYWQGTCFPGQKRFYYLKYRTILVSDDLTFHMFLLKAGHRYGIKLYRQTGMSLHFENNFHKNGVRFVPDGDPTYIQRPGFSDGYSYQTANTQQRTFNDAMISVWKVVEWSYMNGPQQMLDESGIC